MKHSNSSLRWILLWLYIAFFLKAVFHLFRKFFLLVSFCLVNDTTGFCTVKYVKQGKCNCFGEDNFLSCQFINNHGILWTTTITQSDVLRYILHSSRELVLAALTALFSSDWHLIFPSCFIYLLLLRIAPRGLANDGCVVITDLLMIFALGFSKLLSEAPWICFVLSWEQQGVCKDKGMF